MDEIVNKVAQSGLLEFNLEEYYLKGERIQVDMKDFLTEIVLGNNLGSAYMLKEKEFRLKITEINPLDFENKLVAIHCSVDAVVPTWAYMLLSMTISNTATQVIYGNLETLETILFDQAISKINIEDFKDKKVVIKGCSNLPVPISAYTQIASILKPVVKSLMYGEPCSTVPLFKAPKSSTV